MGFHPLPPPAGDIFPQAETLRNHSWLRYPPLAGAGVDYLPIRQVCIKNALEKTIVLLSVFISVHQRLNFNFLTI